MGAHRHVHNDTDPITAFAVRRALIAAAALAGAAALVGVLVWWPSGDARVASAALGFSEQVDATVAAAELTGCSYNPELQCDVVTAEVTSGPDEGDVAVLEFGLDSPAATLRAGDDIVLNDAGPDVPPQVRYSFADFQRGTPLLVLALLFAAAVVAVGRWKGVLALVGLVASLFVLLSFVLPALLRGSSPLGVALTGATVIAFVALYVAHGVGERTTVALMGTIASLLLATGLALAFAGAAELTGLASEESFNLLAFAPDLDFRGLFLAAVIIGALGVLDDVTVTQTSAVWELHRADPRLGVGGLYAAGIRIGRDHIASTVNTLVLAYSAAALPLLLIYTQSGLGLGRIVRSETVALEVVQTLVGSIGLVASVPITTALAAFVVTRPAE